MNLHRSKHSVLSIAHDFFLEIEKIEFYISFPTQGIGLAKRKIRTTLLLAIFETFFHSCIFTFFKQSPCILNLSN